MFGILRGITIMSILIYCGLYSEIEGLNNIGIVLLWLIGISILFAAFDTNEERVKERKAKNSKNRFIIIISRIYHLMIILSILYAGHIWLGLIYLISTVALMAENSKEDKYTT